MKPLRFSLLLAALSCLAVGARAEDPGNDATNIFAVSAAPHTSIILIQCHGLGAGDLSCYGQTNFQTPNLDRLAAGGIRFTNYQVSGTNFSQAQAMLMTGSATTAAPGTPTLAQRLQQVGYHTGMIGEWALGTKPWLQGFDEFAGFLDDAAAKDYYADYLWRFTSTHTYNQITADWDEWNPAKGGLPTAGPEMIYANSGGKKGKYMPDLLLMAAANFVRLNQPAEINLFRPFFLVVNLPAPRSATPGADDFPVPTDAPFTSEAWPPAAKNRAALVTRLDTGIGRLLEQLKKSGLTNDVALFFTSAVPPDSFKDAKMNFLNPNGNTGAAKPQRLPMMVLWPAEIPAGQVSLVNWSAPDFAPTVLELALGKAPTNFTGHSVLAELRNQPPKPNP